MSWVRGYGLVDSPKVATAPGKILNLTAVPAPSAAAGRTAEYYPGDLLVSMLKVPDKSEFPGTGPQGNGMPTNIRSQAQWLDVVKTNGCYTCHQLGNKATRTIPKEFDRHETGGGLGAADHFGQAQVQMAKCHGPARRAASAQAVRGLDPIASPRANCRPQSRRARKGPSATSSSRWWDWSDPKVVSTRRDIDRQAQAHGQRLRKDLRVDPRTAPTFSPCSTTKAHAATTVRCRCAIPRLRNPRTTAWRPRPIGGGGGDLGQPGQHAQSDDG